MTLCLTTNHYFYEFADNATLQNVNCFQNKRMGIFKYSIIRNDKKLSVIY